MLSLTDQLFRLRDEPVHLLITQPHGQPLVPALENRAISQFVPGETSGSITRFLDHWQPDLGLVIGLPDRPALFSATHDRGIPLYLASASRNTLGDKKRLSLLSASIMHNFTACLAASAADAQAIQRDASDLPVEVTGPMTDTATALPCDQDECDELAKTLAGRPVWLAINLGLEELDAISNAHRQAFRATHRLLLVITPSNSADAPMLQKTLEKSGWHVGKRSAEDRPTSDIQVLIADDPDELGLWYRLGPISFMGGTLSGERLPADPFEAAALGSAVLHGPELGTAKTRFQRLAASGATIEVPDANALGDTVQRLQAPDKAAALAQAGWAVTTESAHVVERLAEMMAEALDQLEGL